MLTCERYWLTGQCPNKWPPWVRVGIVVIRARFVTKNSCVGKKKERKIPFVISAEPHALVFGLDGRRDVRKTTLCCWWSFLIKTIFVDLHSRERRPSSSGVFGDRDVARAVDSGYGIIANNLCVTATTHKRGVYILYNIIAEREERRVSWCVAVILVVLINPFP